jgi:hypothetical protein
MEISGCVVQVARGDLTIITAENVDESLPWYCDECGPVFDRLALLEVTRAMTGEPRAVR